ncbi:MAG: ATP-dependent protease ATPase subunit HslU [Planctomycetaceae bacterium]|nr:ATP-dependent protease ATPase subunit HslU [Planctomycetaceae bacterium]
MTPREIVRELDRFIVGQNDAKRSVAIAVRNRWRRQNVDPAMREEIAPKNILMIGPTGVGKTEIARRLATLTGAPFIKVEATKYTEVGYYGRDVESMIRELVENAIGLVRAKEQEKITEEANRRVVERLVDLLFAARQAAASKSKPATTVKTTETTPAESLSAFQNDSGENASRDNMPMPDFSQIFRNLPEGFPHFMIPGMTPPTHVQTAADDLAQEQSCDKDEIRRQLIAGELESETVTISIESKASGMPMMMGIGGDMDNLQDMIEKIMPKRSAKREMTVREARIVLFEQECENLINKDKVDAEAVELAENTGIIFIDEIDKIVASERSSGADVSRQGVQRDLLPIVEGTTVQTRYGYVKTDHILFIAAGAFHKVRPSDLMPELQGRFPIRVELQDLTRDDFVRILTEPRGALTKQYTSLMKTEGVDLVFEDDAIEKLASYAFEVNQTSQNIGARRLATIMEKLLEELSFEAPDMKMGRVAVNAVYVAKRLEKITQDEDLNKFIL